MFRLHAFLVRLTYYAYTNAHPKSIIKPKSTYQPAYSRVCVYISRILMHTHACTYEDTLACKYLNTKLCKQRRMHVCYGGHDGPPAPRTPCIVGPVAYKVSLRSFYDDIKEYLTLDEIMMSFKEGGEGMCKMLNREIKVCIERVHVRFVDQRERGKDKGW